MPPAARPGHADAHFLELLALLRRQNLVDLPVRGVEFEANLRADGVHRRVDSSMVRVEISLTPRCWCTATIRRAANCAMPGDGHSRWRWKR